MRSSLPWLLLACAIALLDANQATAATRVPLVINEAFPDRAIPWPITTGVPFPRRGLTKIENCRLVDDLGNALPFEAKVAATWDAEKSSIRWLTIVFIAQPSRTYALEFGDDVRTTFARIVVTWEARRPSIRPVNVRGSPSWVGDAGLRVLPDWATEGVHPARRPEARPYLRRAVHRHRAAPAGRARRGGRPIAGARWAPSRPADRGPRGRSAISVTVRRRGRPALTARLEKSCQARADRA